jgi:hypothetical protein
VQGSVYGLAMIDRIIIALLLLAFLCGFAEAQEAPDSLATAGGYSLLTQEHLLLFAYPSELKVLGFRSYDIARELEAMDWTAFPFVDITDAAMDETSSVRKGEGQRLCLAMPFSGRVSSGLTLEGAGRFVLLQALRLGYQVFRESTRRGSLTEFDYLELPQGTGVLRTFEEAQREALLRGEMQSLRTHKEKRESEKNVIPEQK